LDLFPTPEINYYYLSKCFANLGHEQSYKNLVGKIKGNNDLWQKELIKRIDKTILKGRFSQELSSIIDKKFIVPEYIKNAILHIAKCKNIKLKNVK
jgi:hypothetical protein